MLFYALDNINGMGVHVLYWRLLIQALISIRQPHLLVLLNKNDAFLLLFNVTSEEMQKRFDNIKL